MVEETDWIGTKFIRPRLGFFWKKQHVRCLNVDKEAASDQTKPPGRLSQPDRHCPLLAGGSKDLTETLSDTRHAEEHQKVLDFYIV